MLGQPWSYRHHPSETPRTCWSKVDEWKGWGKKAGLHAAQAGHMMNTCPRAGSRTLDSGETWNRPNRLGCGSHAMKATRSWGDVVSSASGSEGQNMSKRYGQRVRTVRTVSDLTPKVWRSRRRQEHSRPHVCPTCVLRPSGHELIKDHRPSTILQVIVLGPTAAFRSWTQQCLGTVPPDPRVRIRCNW